MIRARLLATVLLSLIACSNERPIALPPTGSGGDRGPRVDGGPTDPEDDAQEGVDAREGVDAEEGVDAREGEDARPMEDARQGVDAARDAEPARDRDAPDTGGPELDLAIRFATPPPLTITGGGNLALQLEVRNVGARNTPPTEVLVDIRPGGAPVSSATPLTTVGARSLQAGGSETLMLTVVLPASIVAGNYTLRAVVDPNNLVMEADEANNAVEATAAAIGLEITPLSAALGPTFIGCPASPVTVTLRNVGVLTASINSASIVGTGELSVGGLVLPRGIQPGMSAQLTLGYTPIDSGTDTATLQLGVDQGTPTQVTIPVSAEGRTPPQHTERFALSNTTARLDLLMLIDDSCSMSEEQTQLSAQVPAFLQWAQANNVDFHVAVVTTDMDNTTIASGRFQGSPLILTPNTPNLMAAFANNIQRGTNGSGNEEGLAAIVASLTPPLSTGVNQGFLRPDAVLGVLVLSDEEDFSTLPATDYIAQLAAVKPQGMIRVNAIVTPAGGCVTGSSDGLRYIQMAQQFNGTVDSICASMWQGPLTTWGMIGGVQRRFVLTRPARGNTIAVRQNGQVIASGAATWSYEAASNAVLFNPGVLMPGATLEIVYTEGCAP